MGKVSSVIRGRPVCIMVHGASLNELESRIEEYRDQDICWVGLGLFTTLEQFILSKIQKELDIVFDCASVAGGLRHHYETAVRMPRLERYLQRPANNLWITTHGVVRDCIDQYVPQMRQYMDKVFLVDHCFPPHQIGHWMDVPNSLTLLIAAMLAGGAPKIFIFGLDGYRGELHKGLEYYYKPEFHKQERIDALGSVEDPGINRDTDNFETKFPIILRNYRRLFGSAAPIYNVSPKSVYSVLPKINYEQVKENM